MKCELCHRETISDERYCEYHMRAYSNVTSAFTRWQKAYGGVSWTSYLERLASLSETGFWVKELAQKEFEASKSV